MNDEIPPEVQAFGDDIADALADDAAALSIRDTPAEPGTEPGVVFCIRGLAVFHFGRAEFLEAIYGAGCDAMADLQRAGLPLAAAPTASTGPIQ